MRKAALLFVLAGFLPALISCTSVPYSRWNSSSGKVIDLVNAKDSSGLAALTSTPFLFDREIMVQEKDAAMIWNNIAAAGFSFGDAAEADSLEISPSDYALFGETMEVKTWFAKYLPENASLVKIRAGNGIYYMILGDRKWISVTEEDPPVSYTIYGRGKPFYFGMSVGSGPSGGRSVNKEYPSIHAFAGPVR